ncbi:MAG: Gfo/Idh/MocA family oxidoreductase [Planctomycetota bacterium]|nr:Gfo/Idh/MocA family oxidoreductase [Planctomycetota bacterium]
MASTRRHTPTARHLGVAMLGTGFMGRAHSNAWLAANRFFDLSLPISLEVVAGIDAAESHDFGKRWGWKQSTVCWQEAILNPSVTLVDVATPNDVHCEHAIAALEAGRHVACEKPLAGTLSDAKQMVAAAKRAKKCRTFVWFNYRRCPAVALARQLVQEGRLGRIFHIRAAYLQDWGGPSTPLLWRFQRSKAGSGAHGDLNAHIVDMARFITSDDITEVVGAMAETFVKERDLVDATDGHSRRKGKGKSTVDDAALFLARFKSGAVASFEASRVATGNKNCNTIEINGEHGSVSFDFERMNELRWWDNTVDATRRGWTTIHCTESVHPYAGNYWPAAHSLGYEHGHTSMAAEISKSLSNEPIVAPLPDFADALITQAVLEAAMRAARERRPVSVRECLAD